MESLDNRVLLAGNEEANDSVELITGGPNCSKMIDLVLELLLKVDKDSCRFVFLDWIEEKIGFIKRKEHFLQQFGLSEDVCKNVMNMEQKMKLYYLMAAKYNIDICAYIGFNEDDVCNYQEKESIANFLAQDAKDKENKIQHVDSVLKYYKDDFYTSSLEDFVHAVPFGIHLDELTGILDCFSNKSKLINTLNIFQNTLYVLGGLGTAYFLYNSLDVNYLFKKQSDDLVIGSLGLICLFNAFLIHFCKKTPYISHLNDDAYCKNVLENAYIDGEKCCCSSAWQKRLFMAECKARRENVASVDTNQMDRGDQLQSLV